MSHRHFCAVAGHYWECEGTALRLGDREPSICMCLPCGLPLEGFDHSQCHDPVELLACPEHHKPGETSAFPHEVEPGAEPVVIRDKDGNPIFGFCLWCGKDFYCWEEVEAHNADNMKACPVHQELTRGPAGYPYMPPVLQAMLEEAGLLNDEPDIDGHSEREQ